jgi:hypothetical protein
MRFTAEHGHAILNGTKRVHYLPTDTLDLNECPVKAGDLVPLHFPEQARDSYGQIILDSNGHPRTTLTHQHYLRILSVQAEDVDGIPGSATFEIRFKLEVPDRDEYMARGAGHTTTITRAIDDARWVDPDTLDPHWERAAQKRHDAVKDQRTEAKRLTDQLRAA